MADAVESSVFGTWIDEKKGRRLRLRDWLELMATGGWVVFGHGGVASW